jgi:hypothetical protein
LSMGTKDILAAILDAVATTPFKAAAMIFLLLLSSCHEQKLLWVLCSWLQISSVCVVVVVISGPLLLVNTNGGPYQICAWRRRKFKSLLKAKQFFLAKFRKLGNLLGWETPKSCNEIDCRNFNSKKLCCGFQEAKQLGGWWRFLSFLHTQPAHLTLLDFALGRWRKIYNETQHAWDVLCKTAKQKLFFANLLIIISFLFTGPNFNNHFHKQKLNLMSKDESSKRRTNSNYVNSGLENVYKKPTNSFSHRHELRVFVILKISKVFSPSFQSPLMMHEAKNKKRTSCSAFVDVVVLECWRRRRRRQQEPEENSRLEVIYML